MRETCKETLASMGLRCDLQDGHEGFHRDGRVGNWNIWEGQETRRAVVMTDAAARLAFGDPARSKNS